MRIRYPAAIAGLAMLVGCDKNTGPTQPQLQDAAIVRYVNAVPDTSALDFRMVDGDIEGSPQWASIGFRQFTSYQRVRPGQRQIRIFTNPAPYGFRDSVARQIHIDTVVTLRANERYTIISYGFSNPTGPGRPAGAIRHRLWVIVDTLPSTVAANQVALRTIHAAAGAGNVDIYVQPSEAAAGVSGTPNCANFAPQTVCGGSATNLNRFFSFDTRPVPTSGTGLLYRFAITAPGGTTTIPVTPSCGLPGQVGSTTSNPLTGFQIGQSIITAIVMPPSVAGSRAPQTSATDAATPCRSENFLNVGVRFLPDRNLSTTEQ
jgi:hypothetical protein